jgi:serine/threonine protein kinase
LNVSAEWGEYGAYAHRSRAVCEGGELFHQIVKLTYFSENLARHVILQVANGIRYLHEERGVVHR